MKAYSEFSHLAEQALTAEREGKYNDAALYWQDASTAAQFRVNLEWAQARKAYCKQRFIRASAPEKIPGEYHHG